MVPFSAAVTTHRKSQYPEDDCLTALRILAVPIWSVLTKEVAAFTHSQKPSPRRISMFEHLRLSGIHLKNKQPLIGTDPTSYR